MKMKITALVLIVAGLFLLTACTRANVDDDAIVCTLEYEPVCGVDGKTYGNACSAGDVEIAYEGECRGTQIPNPASKFCTDNGGTLQIRTADDGSQTGYCLMNGKECEEWSFSRGECSEIKTCDKTINWAATSCSLQYEPVCGDDGITYSNECIGCSTGLDAYTVGACEGTEEKHICTQEEKQAEICTMEYNPVCGSDGTTYGNGCSACAVGIDSYVLGEC